MKQSLRFSVVAALVLLTGCTYNELRFRPTDVETQRTMSDVEVSRKRGPVMDNLGKTNQHGQIDVTASKLDDQFVFVYPGYRPTVVKLRGDFVSFTTPDGTTSKLPLLDGDAIPVPMHK
jgi:hypothetical protein